MKLKVTTYAELERWSLAFVNEPIQAFIVVGNPGLQKSTVVRRAVGDKARWMEGTVSAFRLYCELYDHLHKPFVIDDVDNLYGDKNAVRLLKCLCQSEEKKTVAWHTNAVALIAQGIEREFETTTRVCIIANEWRSINKNVGAVEDRGILLHFKPSATEVHERVRPWFDDEEVFSFVGHHLHLVTEPSMRDYVNARSVKQAGMDWRAALMQTWNLTEREMLVARLKWDKSYKSEAERVREFKRRLQGERGASRATYFRIAQRFAKTN
jgi:hypothetical protein